MAGEAAAALLAVQAVQLLMVSLESQLAFGSYWCPVVDSIDTIMSTSFDYIIVGGGTAGSVLANRLSACTDANVLLLEAGGCPPFESAVLWYFPMQANSAYDYNMTSTNDSYAGQNLKDGVSRLTTGKMLGGSSSLNHAMWIRGSSADYDPWVAATSDSSWSYESLLPYFKKSETVNDPFILAENGTYCGTDGPTKVQRQTSSKNIPIIQSFLELGYAAVNYSNADVTNNIIFEPLYQVGDSVRQSSLVSYIHPVKDRSNLYILTGATVSKINFAGTRPSERATGVTFTYSDTTYTVTASSEVILAAGALKTPQLLMLSGVGPADHLTEKNISVVLDLPVGDNLQDDMAVPLIVTLESDNSTMPGANPFEFPVPVTINVNNLNNRTSQKAEFSSINLLFSHDNPGLLQVCTNAFMYSDTICDAMAAANVGKTLLHMTNNALHPKSRGKVRLNTTSIDDQPIVDMGFLSDNTDLVSMAEFIAHTASVVNTTYFKSIGAEIVDLGLCLNETKYSTEFWQCYTLAMSSTMWHSIGTAAMGSVVNTDLLVKGTANLRIVDTSVFPTLPGGKVNTAVLAVAEKISDVIISGRGSCTME